MFVELLLNSLDKIIMNEIEVVVDFKVFTFHDFSGIYECNSYRNICK
jgi:hypothetical protein